MKILSGLSSLFRRKSRRSDYLEGVMCAEDSVRKWISAFPELNLKEINRKLYDAHVEIKKTYGAEFAKGFDDYAEQIRGFKAKDSLREITTRKLSNDSFKLKQFASVVDLLPRI